MQEVGDKPTSCFLCTLSLQP